MGQIQAQIRSQVCSTLDDPASRRVAAITSTETSETYLINELIREYLNFQGYWATASVFSPEANLSQEHLPRSTLSDRLGLHTGPKSDQLPLLYSLAAVANQDRLKCQPSSTNLKTTGLMS
jgi:lisH domain-containing protein FOPNL